MADIFISYSSEDKTIVSKVAGLLEARGWTVWWDRQIPIGQKYDTVIENELRQAGCVLVIWTQRSITSEWVKNEALEAAQKNILVPVVLEPVILPLAFKRIESAMLIGWNGEEDHPELPMLYHSIDAILQHTNESVIPGNDTHGNSNGKSIPADHKPVYIYGIITVIGFIASVLPALYYLLYMRGNIADEPDQRMFYLLNIFFGISAGALVFGLVNMYAILKNGKQQVKFKIAGPATAIALILMGGFFLSPKPAEKTITIRVFDWKKNPLTQGDVKIYLKEYIRTQSIDKMGQALFTGIPAGMAGNKIKIEVASPGYATKNYDTLLTGSRPIELVLPLTTVVFISGKVKTAAEMPIKGVEISVDGTRYYAVSITDGSYNLRLEEYTLGDEITITTSHKDFEDKTFSLRINAPDIKNEDIFLNPVHH